MTTRYYFMGRGLKGNVARVVDKVEYAYLDHQTGEWIEHARVFDQVNFEADTHPISLAKAQRKAKQFGLTLEAHWIDDEGEQ